MSANQKDAKALVRKLLAEGVVDKNIGKTIDYGSEQIHISNEDAAIRFDVVGMQKAFVLMSGRLYRRDFNQPQTTSEHHFQKQLNYHGLVEEVDTRVFKNKLVCACGNLRWLKNADLFQVKKCKPCTYRDRLARRKVRRQG